ncbi:MAG: hypothetical protein RIS36_882 [Pseudomonadota bacterium]
MRRSAHRSAKVVDLQLHRASGRATALRNPYEWVIVVCLCALAALIRLDFMRAGSFVIDADEAIVGLMGQHIAAGAPIPTFYYGQHYMGSLEAICAAGLFSLFGASPFTLQLTPLLFSLTLVVVIYALGREIGGVVAGRVAALLCAVPPVALVVWSYKARGGFIELLVIGACAMLCAVRWLKRDPSSLIYPFLIWLLVGIGWWVNTQILYFMVPIAGCGALHLLGSLRAGRTSWAQSTVVGAVSMVAFLLGSSPYWIYNLRHGFPSLGMFGFAAPSEIATYVVGLWTTALPIILGAKHFWESSLTFGGATSVVYVLYGLIFAMVVWERRGALARLVCGEVNRESQVELCFAVMGCACVVFAVSTFGWLSQAPRYLLPLYVGLFVVCGVWASRLFRVSTALGTLGVSCILAVNLMSCYWGGRALPGEPAVFEGDRVRRDHADLNATLSSLGISLVRTNYWIGYRLAFETEERVKFLVLQEPRQVRIPQYEVLPAGVSEDLVPLLLVPSERPILVGALTTLGYSFEERSVGGYVLIHDLKRPDLDLHPIEGAAISTVTGVGSNPALAAIDGDEATRWATGAPQRDGQSFEVLFKEPQSLAAFEYSLGSWSQDYPRALRIETEDVTGRREVRLSNDEYQRLLAFWKGDTFRFWFSPRKVRRVIFTQTGRHPILDWSIAELRFFTGSVSEPVMASVAAR